LPVLVTRFHLFITLNHEELKMIQAKKSTQSDNKLQSKAGTKSAQYGLSVHTGTHAGEGAVLLAKYTLEAGEEGGPVLLAKYTLE